MLATLRVDPALPGGVDQVVWHGLDPGFGAVADQVGAPGLVQRVEAVAEWHA